MGTNKDFVVKKGLTVTEEIEVSAGSASAPTFSFTGDTDTGIYAPAGNEVGFSTGGTKRFSIDSAQVIVENAIQFIASNTHVAATPAVSFRGDTNTGMYRDAADTIGFSTGGTKRLEIDSAGLVKAADDIRADGQFLGKNSGSTNYPSYSFTGDVNTGLTWISSDVFDIVMGGTTRFRFGASGQLGIGGATYGTDGQVLTSTGASTAPAWEDAGGGGASDIDGLSDAKSGGTNFTSSLLIGHQTTGTLSNATFNVAVGTTAMTSLTSGASNTAVGSYAGATTSSGQNNTYIGYKAGRYLTTDNYNTVLGYSALGSNNTRTGETAYNVVIGAFAADAVTTANNLVAVGYAALGANTSGHSNTAIGQNAQTANLTGLYNTSLGYDTLKGNTTGSRNIAIGHKALDTPDTEDDNIAIGYDALGGAVAGGEKNVAVGNYTLDALTSGDYNIGIGHSAGGALTTGGGNTLLGYKTGQYNTTQSYNTGLGGRALNGVNGTVTGGSNTAVGYNSIKLIQTGTNNTAIGYGSNMNVSTGSDNIAVGYSAGDNITTGDNNVVIGAADVASATGSDQLSISSGDGSPVWITGDSTGGIYSKAGVVAVTGNTTLTQAQSGAYVYWTAGTLTLPVDPIVGTQFTIFNNTGSSATVALGSGDGMQNGWASNAAVADNDATTYVCLASDKWVQVGA